MSTIKDPSPAEWAARPLEDMSDCNVCCCWVSPEGQSYHLGDNGRGSHSGVARYILGDEDGGRGLDDKGYMHVSYADVFFGDRTVAPTQAQLNRLFDIQTELERRDMVRAEYIARYIAKQAQEELA